jgi:hypothetical protein
MFYNYEKYFAQLFRDEYKIKAQGVVKVLDKKGKASPAT